LQEINTGGPLLISFIDALSPTFDAAMQGRIYKKCQEYRYLSCGKQFIFDDSEIGLTLFSRYVSIQKPCKYGYTMFVRVHAQSRQSAKLFLQSSEDSLPILPHPQASVPPLPPPLVQGGYTLA
jgi:hypothetical protein